METGLTLTPEVLKAFESVPDLYLILSPDLIILTASNAFLEATYTSRDSIKGKTIYDLYPQNPKAPDLDETASLRYSLEQVLLLRKPQHIASLCHELRKPASLGAGVEEKYFDIQHTPVLDDEGQVAYIIHKRIAQHKAVAPDAKHFELFDGHEIDSSKERIEYKEVRSAHRLLYEFLRHAPAVIHVLIGPKLIFDFVNEPFQQLIGIKRELWGKSFTEAIPELDPELLNTLQQVYATGNRFEGKEYPITLDWHQNGHPYKKFFNIVWEPLRDQHGSIEGLMSFGYEVSDHVLARKQIEKYLEQQHSEKQRLESILNLMPTPLLLMDPETGTVIFANNAADAMAGGEFPKGKPSEEYHTIYYCYDAWGNRIPNDQMPGVKVTRGEVLENFQMDWDTPSGRLSLVVNSKALAATETQPSTVVLAFQDITQIKQAERALQDSEKRFRATFNQAAIPMAMIDLTGEWIMFNEAYPKMFGYSAEELHAITSSQLTHPGDRASDLVLIDQLIKGEIQVFSKEKRYFHHSGALLHGIVHVSLLRDEDNRPQYIVEVIEDITKRKQAEEEQTRLVSIVEKSSDFIGYSSAKGNVIYINNAGQEMVGLKGMDELRTMHHTDFYSPEDKAYVESHILPEVMEKGRWEGEFRFRHLESGELIPVHYNVFSLKDPATGEIQAFATVTSNITQEKQKQNELKEKNEELLRTNNDLDNFIYTASHDLKTPILNLEGLFQVLFKKVELTDELASLHAMVSISFDRFKNTIKDLTEVAKINKGSLDDTEMIRFDDLLEETKETIKEQIVQSGAQIVSNFAVPAMHFSRKNLRSILYNLVSNGVKYCSSDRRPVIAVSTTETADKYILISVSDNGLGMNTENKEKIFGMFERLHNHVEGSGVGLYILKRIVDNAGGRIEVESQIGKGTTFRIYLQA